MNAVYGIAIALWAVVCFVAAVAVLTVALPAVGLAVWPLYQWLGAGLSVCAFAIVVFLMGRRRRQLGAHMLPAHAPPLPMSDPALECECTHKRDCHRNRFVIVRTDYPTHGARHRAYDSGCNMPGCRCKAFWGKGWQ